MDFNSIESQKEIDWANSTFNRQIGINRAYLIDKQLFKHGYGIKDAQGYLLVRLI